MVDVLDDEKGRLGLGMALGLSRVTDQPRTGNVNNRDVRITEDGVPRRLEASSEPGGAGNFRVVED